MVAGLFVYVTLLVINNLNNSEETEEVKTKMPRSIIAGFYDQLGALYNQKIKMSTYGIPRFSFETAKNRICLTGEDFLEKGIKFQLKITGNRPIASGIEILHPRETPPAPFNQPIYIENLSFFKYYTAAGSRETKLAALLSPEVMSSLMAIIKILKNKHLEAVQVDDAVRITFFDSRLQNPELYGELFEAAQRVYTLLSELVNTKEALLANLKANLSDEYTARIFETLITCYSGDSELTAAIEILKQAAGPETGLKIALYLKDPRLFWQALKSAPTESLRKNMENLSGFESPGLIEALKENYPAYRTAARQEILIKLKEMAMADSSDFLVSLLSKEPFIEIYIVKALETCGNRDALASLYTIETAESSDIRIKRAAAQAARAIKSRTPADASGWLSVTETGSGEGSLSLADPAKGNLSISREPS